MLAVLSLILSIDQGPGLAVYFADDAQRLVGKPVTIHGVVRVFGTAGTGLVLDDGTVVHLAASDAPDFQQSRGKYVRASGFLLAAKDPSDGYVLDRPTPAEPERHEILRAAGRAVVFEGVAQRAKGGTVVLVAGEPIYCPKLPDWPDPIVGTPVVVRGTLRHEKLLPEARKSARGEQTQGATGDQWVLDATEWKQPQR